MSEDKGPEDLLFEVVAHMAAWRRLKTAISRTIAEDPEKYGGIGSSLLSLMDACYNDAYTDLLKGQEDLEKQLEKYKANVRYGSFRKEAKE